MNSILFSCLDFSSMGCSRKKYMKYDIKKFVNIVKFVDKVIENLIRVGESPLTL